MANDYRPIIEREGALLTTPVSVAGEVTAQLGILARQVLSLAGFHKVWVTFVSAAHCSSVYMCMRACSCVRACVRVCVCVRACVCACVRACVCVCV